MTEYVVKVDLLITAETEDEAIERFRKNVESAEASIFEVKKWEGE